MTKKQLKLELAEALQRSWNPQRFQKDPHQVVAEILEKERTESNASRHQNRVQ